MRFEFQVRRLGESAALIDTGSEEPEKALERLEDEPAWLGWAAERVGKEASGTRFEPFVMDD